MYDTRRDTPKLTIEEIQLIYHQMDELEAFVKTWLFKSKRPQTIFVRFQDGGNQKPFSMITGHGRIQCSEFSSLEGEVHHYLLTMLAD